MAWMRRRVVLTGLGLISPLGLTLEDNWNSLTRGISGLNCISSPKCSSWKIRIAGEVKNFDPRCLPGKRKAIKLMNRDSQLAVAATGMALEDSKLNRNEIEPSAIGITFGAFGIQYTPEDAYVTTYTASGKEASWLNDSEEAKCLNPIWPLTILPNMSLCHSAISHNIQGPNLAFCSLTTSGAQAIGEAFKLIQYGDTDIFVAGGCSSLNPSYLFSLYSSGLLSDEKSDPQAACRPFDNNRSGLVMGEGASVVVLEELSHALKRNAPIYGELIGYSSTMGNSGLPADNPSFDTMVEGVVTCVKEAIEQAEIDPRDIDYLNADGKATVVSDWAETEAIKEVFGSYAHQLTISSTKSTMGHLLCASAPAELVAGALVLRDGVIPPTINYQNPDPRCDLDYTPNHSKKKDVKVVLSHTIGLNGDNAALILKRFS
jgi:3-oxoacyl-[acyl-carrier-protein] synthase II